MADIGMMLAWKLDLRRFMTQLLQLGTGLTQMAPWHKTRMYIYAQTVANGFVMTTKVI